jgi:flagellar hook-associated protein 2
MGTTAVTPASSTPATTDTAAQAIATQSFTGISTYSADFQAILQREDAIAQLPITALQNTQTNNLAEKQALIALDPAVASLGSDVAALGTLASGGGLSATSSDSSTVSVVNSSASAAGNYTLSDITMATAASETSLNSYSDATTAPVWVAGQNKFQLMVGSTPYDLDLSGNDNLTGLENAINNSGAPATASIINTGSSSYLAISANNVGATTLTLSGIPQTASLITANGSGTETSLASYPNAGTTAVSNSGIVDLTVGDGSAIQLNISPNNNLTGLMNAINSAGAGVTASITTTAGQNSLKLVAAGGPTSITLNDTPGANPVSLITKAAQQGSNASFTLNGTIAVNQPTNVFSNVIQGLSFTLLQPTTGSVSLSVAADPTQLTNALQTFTNDYNAMQDQVDEQTGTGAGPLAGQSIITDISDDLRQLSGYFASSNTSVRSLSDLGITFGDTGQLTFDPTVVAGFSSSQLADAFKFLGSSNSGFAAFANNFTQLSDPVSGLIQTQEDGYDTEDSQITDQITELTQRAALMHNANAAKLEAADALVASLQSDQNTLSAEVQSVNFVSYGAVVNSNAA